jgi:chromosome segregation ATPase
VLEGFMPQPKPIEQLRGLLDERKKVAEKVTEVQATLNEIKTEVSASLAEQCLHKAVTAVEFKEQLMKAEHNYERLLQALRDMQAQIEDRVRPVAQQVVEAEIERLRSLSEQHRSALTDCLAQIDQHILSCRAQMEQYEQTRSNLAALSDRLTNLGANPERLPEGLSPENIRDLLLARVEGLRAAGKL